LRTAMLAAYDVRADDRRLREALASGGAEAFDRLRKFYPVRRELAAFDIDSMPPLDAAARDELNALGFVRAVR